MKKERFVNTSLSLPKALLKLAEAQASKNFGERRCFSRYVRKLILADLAANPANPTP